MRIKKEIITFLKNAVRKITPQAKIFLFGSRVDDTKKGGDIDLLILTPQKMSFKELSKIRIEFYKKFGEQKIDLVNFTFDNQHPFKSIAMDKAIEL